MARRSRRPVGTREFTPWNPAAGNSQMSYDEYAARHPGIQNEGMMRDRYYGATNESGGRAFQQRHEGDVMGDIAEGRIKIIPEAVPGASPSTPVGRAQTGPMSDRIEQILRGFGPDQPGTGGSGDDQVKQPSQGVPGLSYKEYLNGRGSTAMLGGLFRELQGGRVTPKMRMAMMAGAQATAAKDKTFNRQQAARVAQAKRRRQPIVEE